MGVEAEMLENAIEKETLIAVNHDDEKTESSSGRELPVEHEDENLESYIGMEFESEVAAAHELAVAHGDGRKLGRELSVAEEDERELGIVQGDERLEPYIGMEFESEAAAREFYIEYGTHMGFSIRVSSLSRSRRDRSIIARALVCNKEGFRSPDKRRKGIKPHVPTRVGCKAMIGLKKLGNGTWIITKFVKDHSHALNPGKDRKPSVDERIRELSQQLLLERRQSAAYRRQLELVFKHIDEFTQDMSKKIQYIVDNVKEVESKEKERRCHDNPGII